MKTKGSLLKLPKLLEIGKYLIHHWMLRRCMSISFIGLLTISLQRLLLSTDRLISLLTWKVAAHLRFFFFVDISRTNGIKYAEWHILFFSCMQLTHWPFRLNLNQDVHLFASGLQRCNSDRRFKFRTFYSWIRGAMASVSTTFVAALQLR